MLDAIYIARHGFRMPWRGNEMGLSPTGRPRDPVLTAHGVDQAQHLADYWRSLPQDQRPQMVISSPYYRCVQTAAPSARSLDTEICVEAGISEWFPPAVTGTGPHPLPMLVSTVTRYAPADTRIAPRSRWPPLLYPSRSGESIRELHERAHMLLRRLIQRCEEDYPHVRRVLLVSHAATIIAMGRALVEGDVGTSRTDWATGRGIDIGAGTASLSLYRRSNDADAGAGAGAAWKQKLNGSALHLPGGVEREWTFADIPGNVEEPGMGTDYVDEEEYLHLQEEEGRAGAGDGESTRSRI